MNNTEQCANTISIADSTLEKVKTVRNYSIEVSMLSDTIRVYLRGNSTKEDTIKDYTTPPEGYYDHLTRDLEDIRINLEYIKRDLEAMGV